MKKNYLFKNIGRVSVAMGLLATALLSSCLKDTSPGAINFGASPALVGFQYQGFNNVPYVAAIYGKPTDSVDLEVTLSVASITLSSPVTVSIVPDDAVISAFNGANGTTYTALNPADYTLPNGGKITISPGQQIVKVKVSFAGQNIDFSKPQAIGLQLTGANGAIIATNLNTAIITITLKSIYAGTYLASGVRHHPTAGDFPFSYSVAMGTVNKTTIEGNALADLTADLVLQVNPDNTVNVSSGAQADTQDSPGLPNVYNPATKTFTLNYFYRVSAPRKIVETLVYTGP